MSTLRDRVDTPVHVGEHSHPDTRQMSPTRVRLANVRDTPKSTWFAPIYISHEFTIIVDYTVR